MKPILPLCLIGLLLVGCRTDKDFAPYLNQPLKVSVYTSGIIARERSISPSSKEHELLISWLTNHKEGWCSSWVTYAPSILISGTNFTMNIHSNRVIINAGGKQCTRETTPSDFEFLRK
jgi:hypothetical protein